MSVGPAAIEVRAGSPLSQALATALALEVPTWPVIVLPWSGEASASDLDQALRKGAAVVVVATATDGVRAALAAGATDAMLWSGADGDDEELRLRVRGAARAGALPWLRRLHELVSDSVELTDTQARLLDVNPSFERITGYLRDDAVGHTAAELFRTDHVDPSYYRQIGQGLEDHGLWRGQLTARRQDGSLSFQEATVAEVRTDPHGGASVVVGHLAIKRDTSRDNLAWTALRGAEARTRTLLDKAAEGVLVHDLEGRIADLNRATSSLLGRDRDALLQLHVWELEPDLDAARLRARLDDLGDTPRVTETEWIRADGRRIPVALSYGRTEISGVPFVLCVARDITERKRAQRQLEQMNAELEARVAARTAETRATLARLGTVLDNLSEGLLATDPQGRVDTANPVMCRMLRNQCPEGPVGLPIASVDPGLSDATVRCLATRQEQLVELSLPGDRIGQGTVSPILIESDGEVACLGVVALVRDVTLAREVDRMKTDFIATVSHELRTPLTSVLGFAKLARSKLVDQVFPHLPQGHRKVERATGRVLANLDIIASEGKRLSDLINDVLDISKMEAGRTDWRAERIHPADLVARAITVTEALFTGGGPRREVVVADDLPALVGDPDRLLQVLINLLSNAVKFTPHGTVTLSVERAEAGVAFCVSDTGIGIPPERLDEVFEKFRQADQVLTDRPSGTGLGLPICRHIVQHHGGRIWAESEPGKGSRFTFVLPGPEVTPASARRHTARQLDAFLDDRAPGEARSVGTEVLVVDDDRAVRELVAEQLVEAGFAVRVADDGMAAMEAIRDRRPDAVILDVLMPGLTGFDVAAMLRSDPSTRDLPILMHSVLVDRDRGVQVGVDRYLEKPTAAEELTSSVHEVMRRQRGPRRVLVVTESGTPDGDIADALQRRGTLEVGFCDRSAIPVLDGGARPDVILVADGPADDVRDAVRANPELAGAWVVALV